MLRRGVDRRPQGRRGRRRHGPRPPWVPRPRRPRAGVAGIGGPRARLATRVAPCLRASVPLAGCEGARPPVPRSGGVHVPSAGVAVELARGHVLCRGRGRARRGRGGAPRRGDGARSLGRRAWLEPAEPPVGQCDERDRDPAQGDGETQEQHGHGQEVDLAGPRTAGTGVDGRHEPPAGDHGDRGAHHGGDQGGDAAGPCSAHVRPPSATVRGRFSPERSSWRHGTRALVAGEGACTAPWSCAAPCVGHRTPRRAPHPVAPRCGARAGVRCGPRRHTAVRRRGAPPPRRPRGRSPRPRAPARPGCRRGRR